MKLKLGSHATSPCPTKTDKNIWKNQIGAFAWRSICQQQQRVLWRWEKAGLQEYKEKQ